MGPKQQTVNSTKLQRFMKGIVVGRGKCLLAKYSDHTSKKKKKLIPPFKFFFAM